MNENRENRIETIGSIVLQSPLSSKVEDLLETMVKQNVETLSLLRTIATKNEPKEFLRIPEAAALLGIAKSTLYNLASQGRIPRYKNGSANLFKRSDLLEWIESNRVYKCGKVKLPEE